MWIYRGKEGQPGSVLSGADFSLGKVPAHWVGPGGLPWGDRQQGLSPGSAFLGRCLHPTRCKLFEIPSV